MAEMDARQHAPQGRLHVPCWCSKTHTTDDAFALNAELLGMTEPGSPFRRRAAETLDRAARRARDMGMSEEEIMRIVSGPPSSEPGHAPAWFSWEPHTLDAIATRVLLDYEKPAKLAAGYSTTEDVVEQIANARRQDRNTYYVRRTRDAKVGWTKVRGWMQSGREMRAWQADGWQTARFLSGPDVRAEVASWEKRAKGYPGLADVG